MERASIRGVAITIVDPLVLASEKALYPCGVKGDNLSRSIKVNGA